MRYPIVILWFMIVSCRPAGEKVDKTTEDTVVYRPGSTVTIESETGTENIPLVTADPSRVCSDLSFYDANGQLQTGTAICSNAATEYANCSADGQVGCVTTETHPSVVKADLANKVLAGQTIAGVDGEATGSDFQTCTSDGETGCVTTSSYKAADMTNVTAGNIRSGVTIAGQAGDYPSATYPLSGASGTADLDASTFNAQIKSATAFEYWSSAGTRQTGAGDADITAANIANGVDIFGTMGTATVGVAVCTHSTQGTCEADAACRWDSGSCEVNPWNIRTGVTLSGTAGSFKGNCRNRANSSIFDADTMPPGNSADTSGSTLDWWDTIDNWNGDNNSLPSEQPVGWTAAHYCGKEVWSDLTADGACDNASDDCLMKDNLTGLIWSESFPVATTAAANTTRDWSAAVEHCEDLSYGGRTDWRLPTQIELFTAYNHGLRELGYKGGGTVRPGGDTLDNNSAFISSIDDYFWSSTSRSDAGNTQNAANLQFTIGYATMNNKINTHQVLCVAP